MSPARPPIDVRAEVAHLIRTGTVRGTAAKLGVSRESLARICGGLPVRPGTVALVRESLTRLAPDDA